MHPIQTRTPYACHRGRRPPIRASVGKRKPGRSRRTDQLRGAQLYFGNSSRGYSRGSRESGFGVGLGLLRVASLCGQPPTESDRFVPARRHGGITRLRLNQFTLHVLAKSPGFKGDQFSKCHFAIEHSKGPIHFPQVMHFICPVLRFVGRRSYLVRSSSEHDEGEIEGLASAFFRTSSCVAASVATSDLNRSSAHGI